ncbi:phosphoesterase [Burkholderia sp. WAC0059]|uniref:VTT domain-containing protein n=1 Tax=Burkholderia sp. WAC0059 TaxID=2066022 RepID=UPI000C7EECCC|nr:VTT domain-containing protein [Burkholderia sp. WAC0059]PLZ04222.1 phosphoesterase [Burkholderia sp. WAC0059]
MEHAYTQLLHLLSAHRDWALAFVFAASFLESLAIIGTFVPGSVAMFVAGALAGTGTLNLGWLFVWAIAGAVAGDGLSYGLGRRYREALVGLWPFSRHPGILTAAHRYFERHGARSVVFARFVAPLRALVPVVAGMAGMTPLRFFAVNVLSALVWAPAHILPGAAFGASLELAGAVSFRLVAIIAILAAAGWLVFHLTRVVLLHASAWADASRDRVARWAATHRGPLARAFARLIDPGQPGGALAAFASGFVPLCATLFTYVLDNVLRARSLVQLDRSVLLFLRSIRTPWADDALARIATLGSLPTLAAVVATVAVWMAWERRWRTVVYWLVAAAGSQLLILALRLQIRHAPPDDVNLDAWLFPSDTVAAMVTVYGFAMFLLVRRVGMVQAVVVGTAGNAIVVAVAFAGLYFGHFLFSDALGGAAFASIWVALVALTAMWRYPGEPKRHRFMPAVMLAVLCAAVVLQADRVPAWTQRATRVAAPVVATREQWTTALWTGLPCYRADMRGASREAFALQWAGRADPIRAALLAAGWTEGAPLSMHSALSLVSPNANAMMLPVLPTLNNGVPSAMRFARSRDGGEGRDVLRFWPTRYVLTPGDDGAAVPIWLGSFSHERLRRPSWPFNVLAPGTDDDETRRFAADPPAGWHALARSDPLRCDGRPITLLEPDAP